MLILGAAIAIDTVFKKKGKGGGDGDGGGEELSGGGDDE